MAPVQYPPPPQSIIRMPTPDCFSMPHLPCAYPEDKKVLTVPEDFKNSIVEECPSYINLIGMSTDVWEATLVYEDGDFKLVNGWADFVRDHKLRDGDVMVFRRIADPNKTIYKGWFKVEVYDSTRCHKRSAFKARNSGKGYQRWGSVLPQSDNSMSDHDTEEEDDMEDVPEGVTDYFEETMTEFHVGKRKNALQIPKVFPWGAKGKIQLIVRDGRTWEFDVHKASDAKYRIGSGWAGFARENNLKIGDLLTFTWLSRPLPTYIVIIIRE